MFSKKYKFPLLILLNTLPFVLNVLLYRHSTMTAFLFPLIFIILSTLNYDASKKTVYYILLQAYILICTVCSGYASARLYFLNISSDPVSIAICHLQVYTGAAIIVITTVITAIIKATKNKK